MTVTHRYVAQGVGGGAAHPAKGKPPRARSVAEAGRTDGLWQDKCGVLARQLSRDAMESTPHRYGDATRRWICPAAAAPRAPHWPGPGAWQRLSGQPPPPARPRGCPDCAGRTVRVRLHSSTPFPNAPSAAFGYARAPRPAGRAGSLSACPFTSLCPPSLPAPHRPSCWLCLGGAGGISVSGSSPCPPPRPTDGRSKGSSRQASSVWGRRQSVAAATSSSVAGGVARRPPATADEPLRWPPPSPPRAAVPLSLHLSSGVGRPRVGRLGDNGGGGAALAAGRGQRWWRQPPAVRPRRC